MREFWLAAISLDPGALDLKEDWRFPFCTPDGLTDLARRAGLGPGGTSRLFRVPDCFDTLPRQEDGSIHLKARAWEVRSVVI